MLNILSTFVTEESRRGYLPFNNFGCTVAAILESSSQYRSRGILGPVLLQEMQTEERLYLFAFLFVFWHSWTCTAIWGLMPGSDHSVSYFYLLAVIEFFNWPIIHKDTIHDDATSLFRNWNNAWHSKAHLLITLLNKHLPSIWAVLCGNG